MDPISLSTLSKVRNSYFKHYIKKRVGDNFARCGKCDSLAAIILQHVKGSAAHTGFCRQLEKHQAQQESARNAYRCMRALSIAHPRKVLTIIHDKMDHGKTASPCFASKNKDTDMFTKLPLSVTGMMAHGHGDERYAHYALDMYPGDCNHTVGSFARLFRNLEEPPMSSSRRLFEGTGRSPLYRIVLHGSDIYVCKDYRTHQRRPSRLFLFHLRCMFSLIIVGKTTSVGMSRHSGPCSRRKGYSRRYMCLICWLATPTTTSIHRSEDGAWTCVNTTTLLSPSS